MSRFLLVFSFILYTLLFSVSLFVLRSIFLPSEVHEEKYIDATAFSDSAAESWDFFSFSGITQEQVQSILKELESSQGTSSQKDKEFEEDSPIEFRFVPADLSRDIDEETFTALKAFLYEDIFFKKIERLSVFLFQDASEVRGRMKDKNIYLFQIPKLPSWEVLSLLIHEFAHYIDIYSFPKTAFWDTSSEFYSISWQDQTHMKPELGQIDFVSGYAMTNQYEDFAESYTYFVLHNREFLDKTVGSKILAEKYSFFEKYLFSQKEFYKQSFSPDPVKSYYWDITKIHIDTKKFLQYLENTL